MGTSEVNPPRGKTPALVVDSSAIRNHLFKSWPLLNRLAIVARAGRINLCVPWLVEQEVLSGIESHFGEFTGQEAFLKSARSLAQMSSEGTAIVEMCDRFERLLPKLCEEARSRFQHWMETAQAERLPLRPEHTEKVFTAYFEGTPPFDRPKNREHFPDAFIYNCVMDLVAQGGEVWFLADDEQLRESLRKTKQVRAYRKLYTLFSDLQVAFDYESERSLSMLLPDFSSLEEMARCSLREGLCGRVLRWSGAVHGGEPTVREVLCIRDISLDRQSVIHVDESAFLIAFEANIEVLGAERVDVNRDILERLSSFAVSIRGHFFVRIGKSAEDEPQRVVSVDFDDFDLGEVQKRTGSEVVQSIPPLPKVAEVYREEFNAIIRNSGQLGVVWVIFGWFWARHRIKTSRGAGCELHSSRHPAAKG